MRWIENIVILFLESEPYFIFVKSLDFVLDLLFSFTRNLMHLFWAFVKRVFNILFIFGYLALHTQSRKVELLYCIPIVIW